MTNHRLAGIRVLLQLCLSALFAGLGLWGCGATEAEVATAGPVIGSSQSSGALAAGTTQVVMSVTTDRPATCKWDTSSGTSYAAMPNTFTTTGGTSHSTLLTGLSNGQTYTVYVRCQDAAGNTNSSSYSISFSVAGTPDTTPPVIGGGQPSGTLAAGTSQATMSVTTNEAATCKWGTSSGTSFAAMPYTFTTTGGTSHSTQLTGLSDGQNYTRYVRCQDNAGNANSSSYSISFSITGALDTTPPVIGSGQPSGALPAGTTQATMSVATNEAATCKWDTSSGTSYAAMPNTFTTTGGTSHSTLLTGLSNGQSYARYVRCQDGAGNATTASYAVSFSVATSSGNIAMSLVASRLSGVAPLAVFFDASGTASTVTSRPFHDVEYRWDFGDPAGGATWSRGSNAGGRSRNLATGPVAAHVFETPGTYTVSLTANDGVNQGTAGVQITVQDPNVVFSGTNTTCVSSTAMPVAGAGGCPSGAAVAQQANFATIMSSYARTGKRVLLKGGDVFTEAASAMLSVDGPGIVGSYGAGKAILRTTGSGPRSTILTVQGSGTPQIKDWRLMDLEFDGQSDGSRQAIEGNGNFDQLLMLRLAIHDIGGGIEVPCWTASSPVHDQLFLVDSTIQRLNATSSYTHGWLACARQQVVLGNLFDDSIGNVAEHMVRIEFADRAVFSENTIQQVPPLKEMFALRGPCSASCSSGSGEYFPGLGLTGSAAETRKVVVSGNLIRTSSYAGLVIGQVNQNDSTLIRDILVERNHYRNESGSGTVPGTSIEVRARDVTIRNELMDVSNSASPYGHIGVVVNAATAGMAAASNVYIYNNTIYSGSTGEFIGISVQSGASNIVARNNLGHAPNATGPVMVSGSATRSNNSADGQVTTNPKFANSSGLMSNPTDFKLNAGSYAIDAGFATTPVLSDYFGTRRPQGAAIDMGAPEQ